MATALPAPDGWQRVTTIAFNSARKWSAASFTDRGALLFGAPDVLLDEHDALRARVSELAATGRRVLLLARSDEELRGQELPAGVTSVALVTLTEQVRPDAAETLQYFKDQGVAGQDHLRGQPDHRRRHRPPGRPRCRTRTMSSTPARSARIRRNSARSPRQTTVFGRVSPEQKRMLVQALQRNGHVVAMTGDGVNDALALKDADIGVAMGNGAQATKAVAQLVLLDGRFSHMPSVLAEGRRVIGNVERVANLFVAKNVMSLVAIVSAALFTLPFPFLPRHLTLVSAVTIGIPAFFLALGPNKRRYVPGFLRRVLRFAVPAGLVSGVVVLVSYVLARNEVGAPPASECLVQTEGSNAVANVICWQPSSAATIALLFTAFWILVVLSRPFRPWKALLVGSMVALAALAFILPIGQTFFNFSLTPTILWQSLLVGAIGALAIEIIYRTEPAMRAAAGD